MFIPDPRETKRVTDALVDAENLVLKLRAEYNALFALSEPEEDLGKGTIGERILELLSTQFSENFTAQRVATVLNAKLSSVGPNLSRLVSEKKIRKVGHGEYRGFTPTLPWASQNTGNGFTEKDPEALAN